MDPNNNPPRPAALNVSFLPLGGIENVTKNMYLYEYGDEILIVDCGLGFADETMLGVDLLLPDISYLQQTKKKIVGMVITHGHEDHIGAIPFVLPQLSAGPLRQSVSEASRQDTQIPIYASPLTAAFINEKFREFRINQKVQTVQFGDPEVTLGSFKVSFIRVTHSVPDSSNLFIKTPAGNIFHTGDFKFDLTPADGKKSDYQRIAQAGREGVLMLVSDCLGAERKGFSATEANLSKNFEEAMRDARGKCIITTYSSNITRLNQAVQAAARVGRKVCFVGRSLIKAKTVGKSMGYLQLPDAMEVPIDGLKRVKDHELLLLVAGSQGQENSAMMRIANDEHRDVALTPQDLVIISSDIIPGNEVLVHDMLDAISKKGARILYRDLTSEFHVSGHGNEGDLMLMMSLINPQYLIPVSGTYRQMVAYRRLAKMLGYADQQVILTENGREIVFAKDRVMLGRKIEVRNVYVDQVSGEEVEGFVLRDRERLAREGVVMVLVEVNSATGELVDAPEVVVKGFSPKEIEQATKLIQEAVAKTLLEHKNRIKSWIYARKVVEDAVSRVISSTLHRSPLVLPVVIEV